MASEKTSTILQKDVPFPLSCEGPNPKLCKWGHIHHHIVETVPFLNKNDEEFDNVTLKTYTQPNHLHLH